MPRVQARHIKEMDPGTRIQIGGRTYMRLVDYPDNHAEEWVVDLETGWAGAWYRLCLLNDMVVVLPNTECAACRKD